MKTANQLSADYLAWFKSRLKFSDLKDGVVQIDVPFYDNFQDEITMYAIPQGDGQILLTDDGWSIDNLESHGVSLNRSKKRQRLLRKQVRMYGVSEGDGELSIKVPMERFPEAKHQLLQAMLFVNDMFMTATVNSGNFFMEDLKNFFEEHQIRVTEGVSFLGASGLAHKFDFLISGFKQIPTRLIKTLSISSNSQVFAQSILTDIVQTRQIIDENTDYYVFINDEKQDRNRRVRELNPEILNLFRQNGIRPVKFSERDQVVNELVR